MPFTERCVLLAAHNLPAKFNAPLTKGVSDVVEENYGFLWRVELHIDTDYHRAFICSGVLFQQLLTFNEL